MRRTIILNVCIIRSSCGLEDLLKLFRSLPDNDGDAGKQHAKGEECAAQPRMLSDVDEDGGEQEYEEAHGGTEE